MIKYTELGTKIKSHREKAGLTITELAGGVGVSRPYISRLESGLEKPTALLISKIITALKLNSADANNLTAVANVEILALPNDFQDTKVNQRTVRGFVTNVPYYENVLNSANRKEWNHMENKAPEQAKPDKNQTSPNVVEIKVSDNTPVLYTDSAYVTASNYGIVIDFAQTMGPTNKHNVVARIGMSREHAEALMGVLQQKIVEIQGRQK